MKKKYRSKIEDIGSSFQPIWDIFFCILGIPIYYIIDNEMLISKWWFLTLKKIDIKTIRKIKVKGGESGKEEEYYIEIRYGRCNYIMAISPKDKDMYDIINDLTNINSDIEVIYC
jgi:hypothetical protein